MRIHVVVFWVVMPCTNVSDTGVLENLAASIFRVKMEAANNRLTASNMEMKLFYEETKKL